MPRVTYTDPELAQIGPSETEARAKGSVTIARFDFAKLDRAVTDGETEGFLKLMVDKRGRVLGATIVGAHAGELILPWVLAIERGIKLSAVASLIAPDPTMSEVSKRAAAPITRPPCSMPHAAFGQAPVAVRLSFDFISQRCSMMAPCRAACARD